MSSDQGSQTGLGSISTQLSDRSGVLSAVVFMHKPYNGSRQPVLLPFDLQLAGPSMHTQSECLVPLWQNNSTSTDHHNLCFTRTELCWPPEYPHRQHSQLYFVLQRLIRMEWMENHISHSRCLCLMKICGHEFSSCTHVMTLLVSRSSRCTES